jgi:hypothetical protein
MQSPSSGAEPSQLGMVPYGEAPSESHALGWRARWARLAPLPGQAWAGVRRLPWAAWWAHALRLPRQIWQRAARLPWSEWLERLGRERRLQAIGAGVAALLILIFVLLTHRGAPPAPLAPPPQQPATAMAMGPSPEAQRHLATAVMYQRKLWCSDALEELEQAVRSDAAMRGDDELQRTAIACLTPKTRDKALRFLVELVGEPARAPLAAAVVSDPNGDVRRGARMALDRLPPAAP